MKLLRYRRGDICAFGIGLILLAAVIILRSFGL